MNCFRTLWEEEAIDKSMLDLNGVKNEGKKKRLQYTKNESFIRRAYV